MMTEADLFDDIVFECDEVQSWPCDASSVDMDAFDWGSMSDSSSPSPSTTISSISESDNSSPQWSTCGDSGVEYSESKPTKRAKVSSDKLEKNKAAAARCRLKRKQQQVELKSHMSDLENQLHAVNMENNALKLENMTLRKENTSLREQLAKFTLENKASLSGVAVFGVVCMLPLFSSGEDSYDAEDWLGLFSGTLRGLLSWGEGLGLDNLHLHGRVLLSDDGLVNSSSWLGCSLCALVALVCFAYVSFQLYNTPASVGVSLLPQTHTSKSAPLAPSATDEPRKQHLLLRSSLLHLWVYDHSALPR